MVEQAGARLGAGSARGLLVLLVLAGLLVRGAFLSSPPVDAHHVRQADTASMARVMARETLSLWTPRIGWAGPEAGPVEAEFPLYSAAVAAGWRVLPGEPAWLARLVSILAWLMGGVALHRLLSRRFPDLPAALPLALYVLSPSAVLFSRSIQSDALAVAMLAWAWERADASRDSARPGQSLVHSGLLLGLAIALKGPVALWLPVVAYAGWSGLDRLKGRDVLVVLGLTVLPPAIWYFHAHELGADGASLKLWGADSGRWSTLPALLDLKSWRAVALAGIGHLMTPLGALLVLAGLSGVRERRELAVAAAGVGAALAAVLVLMPAIVTHEYYLLPMLPFASVLAGLGAVRLWRGAVVRGTPGSRVVIAVAVAGLMALSAWQGFVYLSWGWSTDSRIEAVALSAGQVLPPGTATVVVDRHPQTLLYALDQTGWHRERVSLPAVRELRSWGAEAMLITESSPSWLDDDLVRELLVQHPVVARGKGWSLLRLDVTQGSSGAR